MKYVYPCIIRRGETCATYVVKFPDLAGATQGDSLFEALEMAEDAAGLMLMSAEDRNEKAPEATPVEKIVVPAGTFVTLIKVDTDAYRRELAALDAAESSAELKVS